MKLDFVPPLATFGVISRQLPVFISRAPHPRMAPRFQDIVEEARLSARALLDYGDSLFNPTVRLAVPGLSRPGKTVFPTTLVHGLSPRPPLPPFHLSPPPPIATPP